MKHESLLCAVSLVTFPGPGALVMTHHMTHHRNPLHSLLSLPRGRRLLGELVLLLSEQHLTKEGLLENFTRLSPSTSVATKTAIHSAPWQPYTLLETILCGEDTCSAPGQTLQSLQPLFT